MKKTLVDLTYFSFQNSDSKKIIESCKSTIGFLEKSFDDLTTHFVVRSKNNFDTLEINFLKIHFFKGNILKKRQVPFRFNRFIKSLKPDYILVNGFGYAHYLIFLKLICPKSKILLQCNGFAPKPFGIKKIVYQISDFFIDGYLFTGIENAKDWYESKVFKKEKVFEVMEGATHFKFDKSITRIENSYLWVGGLNENKDPLTILKAFNRFLHLEPTATLTMVFHENDFLPEVTFYRSTNKKLEKSVFLQGFVTNNELEKIYNQYQFFVLGSHYEGSGYALLEAMACGCVPIVTNIPSFKYMTNNGDCALLFSPSSEEELFNQLIKSQEIDISIYQKKVLKQFEENLSFNAIAKTITKVFHSL